jgi:hypothetical protein
MTAKDEALKLAHDYLDRLVRGLRLSENSEAVQVLATIKQALEQPAQPAPVQPVSLPFGVGGGLVAIKTLLSRDPCAHAKVAIEMIDAMLAAAPEKGGAA